MMTSDDQLWDRLWAAGSALDLALDQPSNATTAESTTTPQQAIAATKERARENTHNSTARNGSPQPTPIAHPYHAPPMQLPMTETSPTHSNAFGCPKCTRTFRNSSGLARHYNAIHRTRQYFCRHEGCYQSFPTAYARYAHERGIQKPNRPYRCGHPNCVSSFTKRENLRRHITEVHERKGRAQSRYL